MKTDSPVIVRLAADRQLVHDARFGPGAVAHLGLEGDAVLHPVHDPGLGHHRLSVVQFHLHHLHIIAEYLIADFMGFHSAPPSRSFP